MNTDVWLLLLVPLFPFSFSPAFPHPSLSLPAFLSPSLLLWFISYYWTWSLLFSDLRPWKCFKMAYFAFENPLLAEQCKKTRKEAKWHTYRCRLLSHWQETKRVIFSLLLFSFLFPLLPLMWFSFFSICWCGRYFVLFQLKHFDVTLGDMSLFSVLSVMEHCLHTRNAIVSPPFSVVSTRKFENLLANKC